MTIDETIKHADSLGMKSKLLEWIESNKDWDKLLYSDLNKYYEVGLKIISNTDSQKNIESFDKGYWKTKSGHKQLLSNKDNIMINLVDSYMKKYDDQLKFSNKTNDYEYETYSQIGQDLFVINLFDRKRNGLFLDIGGGPPHFINNTYLLEKKYGWNGISIDLDFRNKIAWECSDRNTTLLYEDAFDIDYNDLIDKILIDNNSSRIDYLSLDLEPPSITLELLYKIITTTKHRFSVITFEHDSWRGFDYILKSSRDLLNSHGYQIVADNINNQEDWYIDSTY